MKKIIETDLVSIAHKILQMKDKSDVNSLLNETEKLYQKLILLKFYEDNKFQLDSSLTEDTLFEMTEEQQSSEKKSFEEHIKNKTQEADYMSADIVSELIEDSKNDEVVSFEKDIITPQPQHITTEEEIREEPETTEEIAFTPSIEETKKTMEEIDEQIEEIETSEPVENAREAAQRVTLEIDPVFAVPHDDLFMTNVSAQQTETITLTDLPEETESSSDSSQWISHGSGSTNKVPFHQIPVNKTINDAFSNTIIVGLNDRIAFEKHLFKGNSEDFNRVLSQLNTMSNYQDAKDFIEDLVKPDFNSWKGKEEYEQRFMALVEKRFI